MAVIITDPDNIIEADDVTTNTTTRRITINPGSGTNIPAAADGIAEQALYSWYKEEWKDVANRSRYPFLFDAITPEQMEMRKGWQHSSTTSEKAVRTGGWRYIDTDNGNKIVKEFFGAVSLGTFEDATADTAYYVLGDDPTDTGAAVDFDFPGPVNEPVLVYENLGNPDTCNFATTSTITRATGSFITDGYAVGGQVTVLNSDNSNDGTYVLTAVAATTLTVTGTPFTTGADSNAELAVNNRNAIALFLRERDADPNGKTYSKSTLTDIGVTEVDNKVFRFPLSNATDLKISETDANISANSPYTEVRLRYLDQAYNREVDSTTKRDFGIVIDVGTYSRANGASATSTLFSSANINLGAGEALADYAGGTLIIHEGTDQGTHSISGTPVDNAGTLEITLTVALTATESNLSFTMERATPLTASAEEIFEKVQYQLRQAADIDESGTGVVTGRTADEVLSFVGDELRAGESGPENPNGGGVGVIIEGFDSNDTNRIKFYDNTTTQRSFPFVAAGNILVNQNAVDDTGPAEYVMYFEYTERFTNTGFGISAPSGQTATLDSSTTDLVAELSNGDHIYLTGFTNEENNGWWVLTGAPAGTGPWTAAVTKNFPGSAPVAEGAAASVSLDKNPIDTDDAIVVQNDAGSDITGTVVATSIGFDFDYDNNIQGGRTAGTDAAVIVRVLGTDVAVNAEGSGNITQNTGISISVSNPLERNYLNP